MNIRNFYQIYLFLVAASSINILFGMEDVEMTEFQQPVAMEVVDERPLWQAVTLRELTERCFQKKEYSVKHEEGDEPNLPVIEAKDFEDALDAYLKNFADSTCVPSKWIDYNAPSKEVVLDSSDFKSFRHPFAQKLKLNSKTTISIVGDVHGSVHSDFRRYWRHVAWSNLNENFEIINPNHVFIYLGDFVNRGRNSVEIIFKNIILALKNPGKFFMICGNHENPNMGSISHDLYTIHSEIDEKYGQSDKDAVERIKRKLACFYDTLPQVLYVGCGNFFMQCCHGGFDPSYDPVRLLTNKDVRITYECLKNKNLSTEYLSDEVKSNLITHLQDQEKFLFGDKSDFYCAGFTWSDFTLEASDVFSFSGYGYNIPLKVVKKYLSDLNKKLSREGISLNAIINGHHHSDYGLGVYRYKIKESSQFCNWVSIARTSELDDPNGLIMSNYFPVFTHISAPEGVGNDDSHGNEINFDKDTESIITVYPDWKKWRIKPYEFVIPKRSEAGLFCTIGQGLGDDPLKLDFYENKPERIITFDSLKVLDLFEQTNIKKIVDRVYDELEKEKQKSIKKEPGTVSLKKLPGITAMTQSLVHFKYVEGLQNIQSIDQVVQIVKSMDCFKNMDVVNQIKKILAREQIFNDKYFVMYHGCDFKLMQLYLVLQLIYSWGFLRNDQPLPTRFIEERKTTNLESFLNYMSDFTKKTDSFHYTTEDQSEIIENQWLDEIPEFRDQLLSVNCALTGNSSQSGESSIEYWLSRASESEINIEEIFNKIIEFLNIQPKYIEKISSIQKKFLDILNEQKGKLGILLQMFIDRSVFDEIAYFAQAGGAPFDHPIFENFDKEKLYHTKSSPFLYEYVKNPQRLDQDLNKYEHIGVAHRYKYDLDNCQFRIWLPSPYLYNPQHVKTFYYPSLNEKEYEKFIQDYLNEINQVFKLVIKDIIRQKVVEASAPFDLSRTQLKNIEHKIVKLISDLKVGREISRLGVDSVKSPEAVTTEQKFNNIAQMDQISPSARKDLIDYLKKFGRIKLQNSSTPLIFAIQLNKLDIVKLVFESGEGDYNKLRFFEQDGNGQTALLWALKNKNKEIIDFLVNYLSLSELKNSISKNELIALVQCPVQSAHEFGFGRIQEILKSSDSKLILEMEDYLVPNSNKEDANVLKLILKNIISKLDEVKIPENQINMYGDRLFNVIKRSILVGLTELITDFASELQVKISDITRKPINDLRGILKYLLGRIVNDIEVYSACDVLKIMAENFKNDFDILTEIINNDEALIKKFPDENNCPSSEDKTFLTVAKFADLAIGSSIQELKLNSKSKKAIKLLKKGTSILHYLHEESEDNGYLKDFFMQKMGDAISLLLIKKNTLDVLKILKSGHFLFKQNNLVYFLKFAIKNFNFIELSDEKIEAFKIIFQDLVPLISDDKLDLKFVDDFFKDKFKSINLNQMDLVKLWVTFIRLRKYEHAFNCYLRSIQIEDKNQAIQYYLQNTDRLKDCIFERLNQMAASDFMGSCFEEYDLFLRMALKKIIDMFAFNNKSISTTRMPVFGFDVLIPKYKQIFFNFAASLFTKFSGRDDLNLLDLANEIYKELPFEASENLEEFRKWVNILGVKMVDVAGPAAHLISEKKRKRQDAVQYSDLVKKRQQK